jgi:hypothetical protein
MARYYGHIFILIRNGIIFICRPGCRVEYIVSSNDQHIMKHLTAFALFLLCGGAFAQTAAPYSEAADSPTALKKYYSSGELFMMVTSVKGAETERTYFLDPAPGDSAAYAVKVNDCGRSAEEQAELGKKGYAHSTGRNGNGNGHQHTKPPRDTTWDTKSSAHQAHLRDWLLGYPPAF